jgi:glycosyltransferase involved in cell wall biosynthesis
MITFGIITTQQSSEYLPEVIESIRNQHLRPRSFEILIVGNVLGDFGENCRVIYFDDSIKPGWITRKKNLITNESKHKYIVYMHDYIALNTNWVKNFFNFINGFEVAICPVQNLDGSRFRDWLLWTENETPFDPYLQRTRQCLLPYGVRDLTPFMYISGGFWVGRKDFMLKYPLDETLVWGEAEDVEWSKRVRLVTKFKFRPNASVRLLKHKNTEYLDADPALVKSMLYFKRFQILAHTEEIADPHNDIRPQA